MCWFCGEHIVNPTNRIINTTMCDYCRIDCISLNKSHLVSGDEYTRFNLGMKAYNGIWQGNH